MAKRFRARTFCPGPEILRRENSYIAPRMMALRNTTTAPKNTEFTALFMIASHKGKIVFGYLKDALKKALWQQELVVRCGKYASHLRYLL